MSDRAGTTVAEGCICGHGMHHHRGGDWPHGPVNGPCAERGCDCQHFDRARRILCAHADANGEGAHWLNPGEVCNVR